MTPSLAGWIKGLGDRFFQLNNWVNKERPPSFWMTGFFNAQGFLTAMKQEVCKGHNLKETGQNAKIWALDEVGYTQAVLRDVIASDDGKIEGKTINAPQEGVYVHGLFLEGAGWDRQEGKLRDSEPKTIYINFPIIHFSAMSMVVDNTQPRGMGGGGKKFDTTGKYQCPIYVYPIRNDRYKIEFCWLNPGALEVKKGDQPTKMTPAMKWKLAGVALLCTKD